MPAPRIPDEIHELTGAWEKNSQRRRPASPKSEHPLGSAPSYFAPDERKAWAELVKYSAPGVLTGADRWLCESACIVMAKLRRREELKGAEFTTLTFMLGRAGMTPADRSRIQAEKAAKAPPDDPNAEFRLQLINP